MQVVFDRVEGIEGFPQVYRLSNDGGVTVYTGHVFVTEQEAYEGLITTATVERDALATSYQEREGRGAWKKVDRTRFNELSEAISNAEMELKVMARVAAMNA